MALIVETGAIVTGANSYVTIAQADTYHALAGLRAWLEADDLQKEHALVQATKELEARFRGFWLGSKRNDSATVAYQKLAWPRTGVVDEDGIELDELLIPDVVKDAQCEIAALIVSGSSLLQREVTAESASITSESVGPISVSYGKSGQLTSTFPLIERMLSGVCRTGGNTVSMTIGLTADEAEALAEDAEIDQFDSTTWPG